MILYLLLLIPIPRNNIIFKLRENCQQIANHKWHSIKEIQHHLRSSIFNVLARLNMMLFLGVGITSLFSYERASSYPYLSGDTWRFFTDWRLSTEEIFDPALIQEADTIFVEYDLLPTFQESYLPCIQSRFILITPNCESGTDNPQPGRFSSLLESKKLAAWFVQNIDRAPSERLIAIPIGLANQVWPCGRISIFHPMVSQAPPLGSDQRDILLYVNFQVDNNRYEREPCLAYCQTLDFAAIEPVKPFQSYLEDLSRSVFTISPPGNGLDCHRTWEALLMGSYPIVLSSSLNLLYENLPIVIIHHWEEITKEFLQKKKEEFRNKSWQLEKLYASYWFQKVFAIQKKIKNKEYP